MCGIAGLWSETAVGGGDGLASALAAIRHRGPDGEGRFASGPVQLGMVRLAVIDLEGGQQPLSNENGSVVVVCNGEIYNYRELAAQLTARGHVFRTGSDVEVLVHLYEELGPDLCTRLRGMFAFALWDARQRRLLLGRDRFGKKPLYLARLPDGGLAFASELKGLLPLLRADGAGPGVRAQGVYDFLCLGVVPQPDTIYEGVRALEPGSWASFDGSALETRTYWDLDRLYPAPRQAPWTELQQQAREQIAAAVRVRLRADVPLGVFLSGGLDSSIVAYEASRLHPGITTFTIGVPDPELDESGVAARTAHALRLPNRQLRLDVAPRQLLEQVIAHYDQPFADPSALPSLAVSRLAREHVTVVLNGDGGDEVFAGYRRYLAAHVADRLPARRLLARAAARLPGAPAPRRSALGFLRRFARGLDLTWDARYLAWTTDLLDDRVLAGTWLGPAPRPVGQLLAGIGQRHARSLDRLLATDRRVNLLSDLLVKMDMATMAYALEARSPFLDHELAEWAAGIAPARLLRRLRPKALLRAAYRGLLPREVTRGKKRGFEVPVARWLKGELCDLLAAALAPGSPTRAYLDLDALQRSLAAAGRPIQARPNLLYALLVLHLWLERRPV